MNPLATLLALSRAGAEVIFAAPNRNQHHVINLIDGSGNDGNPQYPVGTHVARRRRTRSIQGNIDEVDALFMPGGFGAAKELLFICI